MSILEKIGVGAWLIGFVLMFILTFTTGTQAGIYCWFGGVLLCAVLALVNAYKEGKEHKRETKKLNTTKEK